MNLRRTDGLSSRVLAALRTAERMGYPLFDHAFGGRSRSQLTRTIKGRVYHVHPDLVDIAELTIRISPRDGTVVPPGGGVRTLAEAQANVANNTGILNSLHRVQSDGFGHAIDLAPYPLDWNDLVGFKNLGDYVLTSAALLWVPIRQGRDWDMDGQPYERGEFDLAHFELPKPEHQAAAEERLRQFCGELGIIPSSQGAN